MTDQVAKTDYIKHTDAQLHEGITKADENLARIAQEGSDEQREAAQEQRDAMQAELDRRQSA
jgi:hypothetical protein